MSTAPKQQPHGVFRTGFYNLLFRALRTGKKWQFPILPLLNAFLRMQIGLWSHINWGSCARKGTRKTSLSFMPQSPPGWQSGLNLKLIWHFRVMTVDTEILLRGFSGGWEAGSAGLGAPQGGPGEAAAAPGAGTSPLGDRPTRQPRMGQKPRRQAQLRGSAGHLQQSPLLAVRAEAWPHGRQVLPLLSFLGSYQGAEASGSDGGAPCGPNGGPRMLKGTDSRTPLPHRFTHSACLLQTSRKAARRCARGPSARSHRSRKCISDPGAPPRLPACPERPLRLL